MSIVSQRIYDVTLRPVGGNLEIGTGDVEVRSTSPTTMVANTWTDMFYYVFNPFDVPFGQTTGKILWMYFYIKHRVRATTVTADIDERIRAQTRAGFVTISDELATANIGTSWIEKITSGWVHPVSTFDEVPFTLYVEGRTNEVDTLRLEVSSLSYVRAIFKLGR